jgi:hypothetical protein
MRELRTIYINFMKSSNRITCDGVSDQETKIQSAGFILNAAMKSFIDSCGHPENFNKQVKLSLILDLIILIIIMKLL